MNPLIPGLPDEIARECLIRVSHDRFRTLRSVSKLWRDEVESPEFHHLRKATGIARPIIALTQSEPISLPGRGGPANKYAFTPAYRLALYEPDSDAWRTLPAIPYLPHGLPLFCQIAGGGRHLVVVGGWDSETWAASDEVFVYDFVSDTWRRGARMPSPRRSFFACAASSLGPDPMVFVAGGHDEDKNALNSALAYHVARDEWVPLPDMARERDECKGVYVRGVFHVIGGYCTEMQGRFGKSAEAFDVAEWKWGPVQEDALETGSCPRTCVASEEGRIYRRHNGHVSVADGATWHAVAELPEDVGVAPHVVAWQRKLMVMGSARHGGPQVGYILELGKEKGYRWTRVEVPEEYYGNVQASCSLEI